MSACSVNSVCLLPNVLGLHSVVDMVIATLDIRDSYTSEHSHRVAGLAELLAEAMMLSSEQCRLVHYAAHLHDIGKIGVADNVLNKVGKLTKEEMLAMQAHPSIGAMILGKNSEFALLAEVVRHHHERWDGKGYPDGIGGAAIPLESRIIGLVDAFDAMTSDRPYRSHKTHEWALEEIEKHAGSQFCPDCVRVFLTLRAKLKLSQYQSSKKALSHHQANVRHHTLMHSQRISS